MNPKQLQKAMKKMGLKQEEIEALEVIIKTKDKDLVIKDPQVSKINMMGQESIQVVGKIEERSLEKFTQDDIKTVMQQANCSEETAKQALEESDGDLAAAILSLKQA